MLEGPNVYRLEPVVKLEVAVGRRRTWYGQRDPGRHALVWDGRTLSGTEAPAGIYFVRLEGKDRDEVLRAVRMR